MCSQSYEYTIHFYGSTGYVQIALQLASENKKA